MGIQPVYSPTPPISQPPIYPPPGISQDARNEGVAYLGGVQPTVQAPLSNSGATTTQTTHLIIHENEDNTKASTSQKAMEHSVAVMTRQQCLDNPPLEPILEGSSSSEEDPDIQATREFLRKQTRKNIHEPLLNHHDPMEDAPLDNPLSDEEDDLYRFVEDINIGNQHDEVAKNSSSRVCNPAEDYDLWADLCALRANISIAQLIQVAPSLRKEFKEGATIPRKSRKTMMTARIYSNALMDDGALEIDVSILDKVIPRTLIDGGSGINIMPLSTMESLGLKVTGPSPYVVNVADQRPVTPLGQIVNCQVEAGGEIYTLTFHVLRLMTNKTAYPLLLGRDWLRRANASERWSIGKSSLAFGPPDNRTEVIIGSRNTLTDSPVGEKIQPTREAKVENVRVLHPTLTTGKAPIDLGPIRNLGPGLYDWEDDGEFTAWLQEHPEDPENPMAQAVNFTTTTSVVEESPNPYFSSETFLDAVEHEVMYNLELDGTLPHGLEGLLDEEEILPPPFHVWKASTKLEEGIDLSHYLNVPHRRYHKPKIRAIVPMDGSHNAYEALHGDKPQPTKMGAKLAPIEVAKCTGLVRESQDTFAWPYKHHKGIPPETTQHSILHYGMMEAYPHDPF
jgi:hypothetical protein